MNILSSLQVKTEAKRLGFSACGLAPAAPLPPERAEALHRWLAAGMHGGMDYLQRHAALRLDPALLVPGARTVVSVALNYYPAATPPEGGFRLARYALGLDYHDVMRQRLRALLSAIGSAWPELGAGLPGSGDHTFMYHFVAYRVLGGVRGSGTRTDAPAAARFRMAYEFAEFARIIASHDTAAEAAARARTLAVMDLLDALHGRA